MARHTTLAAVVGMVALTGLSACGNGGSAGGGDAADYPSKTVRLIVPYPAGGGTDIAARAVAPCLEGQLGETVIVENKAGGSGAVGTTELISQPADGHTLELVLTSSAVVTPLSNDVGYTLEDQQAIGQVASFPYVILVNGESSYTTLEDLLTADADLKAAAPGAASQGTLELEAVKKAGAPITLVPFDGTAGVKSALLGNQVDFGTAVVDDDLLQQHEKGTLRILGVTSKDRVDYLPDIPAVNEIAGFEDLGAGTSYFGIVAPAGTPEDITTVLSDSLEGCLAEDSVREIIGPDFVSDTYVDGPTLQKEFEEQSKAYSAVIGG
ncbi:tripartite tricarboxylate transporter substrate binding protein [Ornithinimicrobium faecis]|uniref:Tripartite tricarboxylate transporter substrate binding protein n=1 Tax=Ornithinimicrobium faecis TaxID=2934158 RepID=A0ABY4YXA8_9MICO|nr:tripartite tricarboxylate transporter substrate binding protein [Ornithinimicrobium sp. HY1793]USQ81385.1 tripartite tricarboxylate transporter substrate binding protein [Ornithinimicrobium sp. HY1793]